MKFISGSLLTLLFAAGSALATVSLSSVQRTSSSPVVPGKYIIEVEDLSKIPSKRDLGTSHARMYSSLRKRGVGFKVDKEFNAAGLFTGASLTLSNPQDIVHLYDTDGVVAIRPVTLIPGPKPLNTHVVKDKSDPKIPADRQSTHKLTGVDKLHAEGNFGQGVKIGILDTGIDYHHPALGGGIGPKYKVIGGYDLVGDAYTGANSPVADSDPMDDCNGHGTHVAGIIGANPGNEYNISGVAYEASLTSYRIFGCDGSVTDDIIVSALLLGVKEKQDILTLSLGGTDGWTEGTASVVASRIADSGTIVTIAAGNDGGFGSWYTSNPGNGINVISTASLDNTVIPIQNATVHGAAHDPIPYFMAFPMNVTDNLPIYALSSDTTIPDDACNPLPPSTPDLSKYLVIIRRGTCSFVQKLTNAAAKGGKVFLIYNNGNSFSSIATEDFTAALIQAGDGEFLVNQFFANAKISVSFPQSGALYNYADPAGGLISSFSSYGPSDDMFFKPSVTAPGGNILSTIPLKLGGWQVESGTSMATPFLAGSAALMLRSKGRSRAVGRGARTLFESTAQPVSSSHSDSDPLHTVSQQGAGLIDVYSAIHTTTTVSPGELLLNDTNHFNGEQKFSIKNCGWFPKEYRISHVPAGTALTEQNGSVFISDGPVPQTSQYATVQLSEAKLWVWPLFPRTITAKFTPPAGVDPKLFPVYSGFIRVTSGGESLHVTYLGLAASLKDKQVLDTTNTYFGVDLPLIIDSTGNPQKDATNYTFVNGDYPTLIVRLAFGTPLLRVDLVDPKLHILASSSEKPPILGRIFESDYVPRSSDSSDPTKNPYTTYAMANATFADGKPIPNGNYQLMIHALKVTGDRNKEEDYERWIGPTFGVTKAN